MWTTSQRADLDELGWARHDALVTGADRDRVSGACQALLGRARSQGLWPTPRDDGPEVVNLPGAVRADPTMNAWLQSGAVGALGRAALGAEAVRLLQDAVLHKPAGCTGAVPWHCDHTYVGYLQPPRVVSIRVALSPSTESSGCLWVREGSHRWDTSLPVQGGALAIPNDALAQTGHGAGHEAPVVLAAGDASVHGCRLWHRSGPNPSAQGCTVLVFHVADAACVVDERLMSPGLREIIETDTAGRLSGERCPLL